MEIDPSRIEGVSGTFDTNKDKLICVGNSKYGRVSLCFKSNMHVTFADIKLYSSHRARDADATFNDAYALGNEIAERFNSFTSSSEDFKTDGSLSELGKVPVDELEDELLKYSKEELAKIAMAGVCASNLMLEG